MLPVRRSSRIFAAQSANAVKENNKSTSLNNSTNNAAPGEFDLTEATQLTLQSLPSSGSSQTASSQSSSSSTCSSSSSSTCSSSSSSTNLKLSKRLKLKKKANDKHGMERGAEDILEHESLSPQSEYQSANIKVDISQDRVATAQVEDNLDCNSCSVYLECRHCSLLSNQSKSNYLSNYVSLNQQPAPANSSQQSQQSASSRKKAYKFQILIEQSVCLENNMNLLRDIGMAVYNLKQYECEKALAYFELLPQAQLQSCFVLSQMAARAHFELHNYLKAEKIYTQLRRQYPYHLEGLTRIL